jgi:hypothetical protein
MLAVLSLVLFVGSQADTPSRTPQAVPSAKPVGRAPAPLKHCLGRCSGGPTTRTAVIPISDHAFLKPSPDPICVCGGDTIEWTYRNGSLTKDKKIKIRDVVTFLDNGDCKKSKTVLKKTEAKAVCKVLVGVPAGTYKYDLKGSHSLDPEVEVQGGIPPPPPQH